MIILVFILVGWVGFSYLLHLWRQNMFKNDKKFYKQVFNVLVEEKQFTAADATIIMDGFKTIPFWFKVVSRPINTLIINPVLFIFTFKIRRVK